MKQQKFYAYVIGDKKGICTSWADCEKIVKGKSAKYKSFLTKQEAQNWLDGDYKAPKNSKKVYAYWINGENNGIVASWDDCKKLIARKKSRYKSFSNLSEAQNWLDDGAKYQSKDGLKKDLEDGVYFDAGTGRGIGVEVRVTDKYGNSLLKDILSEDKVNEFGNYLTKDGSTNNFGELLGIYIALKFAIKNNKMKIFGDSNLVIHFWSKGIMNKGQLSKDTVELAEMVVKLRKKFEELGGKIEHISGDINPADLGFHR